MLQSTNPCIIYQAKYVVQSIKCFSLGCTNNNRLFLCLMLYTLLNVTFNSLHLATVFHFIYLNDYTLERVIIFKSSTHYFLSIKSGAHFFFREKVTSASHQFPLIIRFVVAVAVLYFGRNTYFVHRTSQTTLLYK